MCAVTKPPKCEGVTKLIMQNEDLCGNSGESNYSSLSYPGRSPMLVDSLASDVAKPQKKGPTHVDHHKWFETVETKHLGKINAKELQMAFEIFQNKHFSEGVCKFVVRIFDLDKNGGLDVREFEQLYFYIKQWVNAFNRYDTTRTGFLEEKDFALALKLMDVNFTPEFIKFLVQKSDPSGKRISLDQYIITCVQIQRFTNEFKMRDEKVSGSISLKYEDFLEMILKCVS